MVYSLEQIRGIITPIAEKYGIPAVYLFGSYARGNAGEESDIDFLLDTTGVNLLTILLTHLKNRWIWSHWTRSNSNRECRASSTSRKMS